MSGRDLMMAADLPPWTPLSKKDRERLIDWTIQKWNDLWGGYDEDDAWREANAPALRLVGPRVAAKMRVMSLLWRRDEAGFVRLMRDPAMAKLAFELLQAQSSLQEKPTAKRSVGRPKLIDGEEGHWMEWPSKIVDDIWMIWKRHYKKSQRRNSPPTAYEVAAEILRREGLDISAEQIEAYRRKVGRPR
jgi:hypothetical protein